MHIALIPARVSSFFYYVRMSEWAVTDPGVHEARLVALFLQ